MASGFRPVEGRNAGGFRDHLHQFFGFPIEIFERAVASAPQLPGHFIAFIPSLIETLIFAVASTLAGAIMAIFLSLMATRGLALWPRLIPAFRLLMELMRAVPKIVIALVLVFILAGGGRLRR